MERNIYRYIWRHSWAAQLHFIALAFIAFASNYFYLLLPKEIVDTLADKVAGEEINTSLDLPLIPSSLQNMSFEPALYFVLLCSIFMFFILLNQALKYIINVYRGIVGERTLRRLRYELYSHVLRFPPKTFKTMSSGEIIPMVTQEVEPLGGFVGEAFSLPAYQGALLASSIYFLFVQNWLMGLAAVALYPLQLYIIPRLQRRVNMMGKERVRRVRRLSDRLGESIQTISEVHNNDAAHWERARFSEQLDGIFEVRRRIYNLKFVIKFINNFINQLGPFAFYSLGGYLIWQGEMSIGVLAAGIAAQKDIASPWKELLRYYQTREDSRIKYEQVVGQFDPDGMMDAQLQDADLEGDLRFDSHMSLTGLSLERDDIRLVDNVSADFALDRHTALVGDMSSGRSELVNLMARTDKPTRGTITIDGKRLAQLPEANTGRQIAFVGRDTQFFAGTIEDHLLYGLRHRASVKDYEDLDSDQKRFLREAELSGNSPHRLDADWLDYDQAGAISHADILQQSIAMLEVVDLDQDVYDLGLRSAINPVNPGKIGDAVLEARARFHKWQESGQQSMTPLVEPFDWDTYNTNASVAENLLFGHYLGDDDAASLIRHPYMDWVLERVGIRDRMLTIGYDVAEIMLELFADSSVFGSELFERFSFISAETIDDLQEIMLRVDRDRLATVSGNDRRLLLGLPFNLVPTRHRLGLLNNYMRQHIIEARHIFAAQLPGELRDSISFFNPDSVTRGASVLDNIVFGKVAWGIANAREKVGDIIAQLVEELDLREALIANGLQYQTGLGASRLNSIQRQKLALARALMKRPSLLVLDDPLSGFDAATSKRLVKNICRASKGRAVIWGLPDPECSELFDDVTLMLSGQVVASGSYDEMSVEGGPLSRIV